MNIPNKTDTLLKTLFFTTIPLILVGVTMLIVIISQGSNVTKNGIISNRGVIKILTDPQDIKFSMYLDDVLITNLTNDGVNADTGEHKLTILADGMNKWEKKINVKESIVNEVFVKLYPLNMDLKQLTDTHTQKAVITKNGDFIYFLVKDSPTTTENGIWRINLSTSNLPFFSNRYAAEPVYKFENDLNFNIDEIIPSPDNTKILIKDYENKQLFVIKFGQNAISLNKSLGFYPEQIYWYENSDTFLVYDNNIIYKYNQQNHKATLLYYSKEDKPVWGGNNEQIVVFNKNKNILELHKNDSITEISITNNKILNDKISLISVPIANNRYFLIKNENLFFLIDIEGKRNIELISNKNLFLQSNNGLNYLFADDGGTLIAVNVKDNIVSNTLELKTNSLPYKMNELTTFTYTTQSNNILIYKSDTKELLASDADGKNQVVLLEGKDVITPFNFDQSSSNLILSIRDTLQSQYRDNIFKLDLIK